MLVGSILLFQSVHAADIPTPFTASYKASSGIIPLGEACITLTRDQGNLKYVLDIETPLGDLREISQLKIVNNRFHPVKFKHQEKSKQVVSKFDRQQGVVTTSRTGKDDRVVSLPAGEEVWDLLSVQLKLMTDLSGLSEETSFKYQVVNKRGKIKPYVVTLKRLEAVETEMGNYKARLVVVAKKDRKFWFAPGLNYMPVKLEIEEVSLELQSTSCKS